MVLSHFGRPDGKPVPEMSLKPVAAALATALGSPIAFAEDCIGDQAKDAIDKLKKEGMKKVLLDLRSNGGGLLDQTVSISGLFVPSGSLIVETRGRLADSRQRFEAEADRPPIDLPLVVLVNNGTASASEILSGAIQGSFVTAMEATPLAASGKLRFLAVGSPKRLPGLPNVPAVAEEIPGFDAVIWFAVFAPKGTPDAVAERLRNAIVQAVNRPEYQKYLGERNAQARTSTPQELTDLIKGDMEHWGDVVRRGNIPM